MKHILLIVPQNFRDEELLDTMAVLEKKDYITKIASENIELLHGIKKAHVRPDMDLHEAAINLNNFSAIIFIGGPGAQHFFENELCHHIAREANSRKKIIGAICIAPMILAKAGILNGVEATIFAEKQGRHFADAIKIRGARYHDRDVVIDRNIVTAKGPHAAKEFALAIIDMLES